MAKNLEELSDLVYIWAKDKGIIDAGDIEAQADKLVEEAVESLKEAVTVSVIDLNIERAAREGLADKLKMEMGDCLVVLTIMASLLDTDLFECLHMAYNKINKRKGKMEGGVFVKNDG